MQLMKLVIISYRGARGLRAAKHRFSSQVQFRLPYVIGSVWALALKR